MNGRVGTPYRREEEEEDWRSGRRGGPIEEALLSLLTWHA